MADKNLKRINDLAEEILKKGVTKEDAMKSLISAGILNKKGEFRAPYQNLAKVVKDVPCMK